MKLLVVGTPGSGKTALVEYAKKSGLHDFFDSDEVVGLCEWRSYATRKVIGDVEIVKPEDGDSWYRKNGWYWKTDKMNELLGSTENPVICGSADNVMDFYSQFDRIILLYKSHDHIVSNLMQPHRKQPNGTDISHHERILRWQETLAESLKPFNPIIISDNDVKKMFEKVIAVLSHKK